MQELQAEVARLTQELAARDGEIAERIQAGCAQQLDISRCTLLPSAQQWCSGAFGDTKDVVERVQHHMRELLLPCRMPVKELSSTFTSQAGSR